MPNLVSIIMPVKNPGVYLIECVSSIQGQTFENWELLAVEDHGSDYSWEWLCEEAEKDPRIKPLKNPGSGILDALHRGFEVSTGTWVTRMDADDYMPPNKLTLMTRQLEESGHGSVVTGLVRYFAEGTLGEGYEKYEAWLNEVIERQQFEANLYVECVLPSAVWMMWHTDFQKIGGFGDQYPEDYDFCFRVFRNKMKVRSLPNVLHFWRDHTGRTSRNDPHYADNAFIPVKWSYFLQLHRDPRKRLVLWGAGRKAKKLVRLIQESFLWLTDNQKKIGHEIHGTELKSRDALPPVSSCQVIVLVAQPEGKKEIRQFLKEMGFSSKDYFFWC